MNKAKVSCEERRNMIEEYIGNLALEVIKDKVTVAFDKKRLKSDLVEYVKKQKKYNETCQLADEMDYQGLMDYVKVNFLEDASERMFHRNPIIRRRAKDHIIAKAIDYAHAESKEAKKRVGQIVGFGLDAIRKFYIKHKPDSYTIVAQIVDEVHVDTEKTVHGSAERIIDKLDEFKLLFLKRTGPELSTNDDIDKIEATWQNYMKGISEIHPLYPYYGYGFMDDQIKSVPLTKEAAQKYPERVKIEGTVHTKNKQFINRTDNPLDYSYRHQVPLFINVSKATKFLGNTVDPRQGDVEKMAGNTVIVYPPQFPDPIPCSIIVGTQTCYDYILLRTQEIKDDGIYVIGNREQGLPFNLTVYVNPADLKKPEYEISLVNPNNHDILKYVKFVYALEKEKIIHIHRLDKDIDWYAGNVGDIGYTSGFETIEEEIDFIERVCCIEDYFKSNSNQMET